MKKNFYSTISSADDMQDDKMLRHISVYLSDADHEFGLKLCELSGCKFSILVRIVYRMFVDSTKEQMKKMNNGKNVDDVQKFLEDPEHEKELCSWLIAQGFTRK